MKAYRKEAAVIRNLVGGGRPECPLLSFWWGLGNCRGPDESPLRNSGLVCRIWRLSLALHVSALCPCLGFSFRARVDSR